MSGPAYFPVREVLPVARPLGFPRVFCPVCAAKWMKQLWAGSCVCTGDVRLFRPMPGGAQVMRAAACNTARLSRHELFTNEAGGERKKTVVRKKSVAGRSGASEHLGERPLL